MNLTRPTARAFATTFLLLVGAGCTDLTVEPKSTVTESNVFNDPNSYQAFLARLYAGLAVSGQRGPAGLPDISGIDEGFSQYLRLYWETQELPTDEAVIAWNDIGLPEMNTQTWTSQSRMVVAMYYRVYFQVVLANEYIENIVATIESGVVAITSAGRIAMFNRAAERLTGLAADEIKGQTAARLAPCLSEPLRASAADGVARTLPEIELPGADRARPVMCTTSPLRDPDGIVLGAVAVFSDLTPLKELEIERRRAERLAYFEGLASGIAHEIKNPLVAIKTFTQLLPRRAREPQFVDEFGRIVGREIHRMERVVDRLRTLAHPGRRPQHAVDVRAPLAEALEFMQATFDEKSVTIDASLGDTPCRVLGDHQNLEQLFLNLLMNAHEATPPGGALSIAVTREAEHVTVSVGDTGPGIAPELLEKIFEPFFTTKQRGSGLGLAISAGVAQAHGARLRAANHPGGGAIFSVQFPLAPVTAPVIA